MTQITYRSRAFIVSSKGFISFIRVGIIERNFLFFFASSVPGTRTGSAVFTGTGSPTASLQYFHYFQGSLPLVLMFDFVPDSTLLNAGYLEEIMHSLDVYISVRPKPKQNVYSVIIKGLERNAGKIFISLPC